MNQSVNQPIIESSKQASNHIIHTHEQTRPAVYYAVKVLTLVCLNVIHVLWELSIQWIVIIHSTLTGVHSCRLGYNPAPAIQYHISFACAFWGVQYRWALVCMFVVIFEPNMRVVWLSVVIGSQIYAKSSKKKNMERWMIFLVRFNQNYVY